MTDLGMPAAYFIAHMGAADFFGLVVSVLICLYLLYALLRGEKF
jgi:K+-transporting ATPase KdpF subunit